MWNLQHIIFKWRRVFWQIFKSALVYLEYKNEHKKQDSLSAVSLYDWISEQ